VEEPDSKPVYRGIPNTGLPGAARTSRKAHLSSAAREARLAGGKQPRFGDNRRFYAICLTAVLCGLVYGIGVWFHGWLVQLDKTGEIVNKKQKSQKAIEATKKAKAAVAKFMAEAQAHKKAQAATQQAAAQKAMSPFQNAAPSWPANAK
jgi:hypothetical protein